MNVWLKQLGTRDQGKYLKILCIKEEKALNFEGELGPEIDRQYLRVGSFNSHPINVKLPTEAKLKVLLDRNIRTQYQIGTMADGRMVHD